MSFGFHIYENFFVSRFVFCVLFFFCSVQFDSIASIVVDSERARAHVRGLSVRLSLLSPSVTFVLYRDNCASSDGDILRTAGSLSHRNSFCARGPLSRNLYSQKTILFSHLQAFHDRFSCFRNEKRKKKDSHCVFFIRPDPMAWSISACNRTNDAAYHSVQQRRPNLNCFWIYLFVFFVPLLHCNHQIALDPG